jgi:hypothetical protein
LTHIRKLLGDANVFDRHRLDTRSGVSQHFQLINQVRAIGLGVGLEFIL